MKIIRNIDGKKLELTLTNEEAMIQANIKAVQRRYVEGESLLTEHPEIIGTKLDA